MQVLVDGAVAVEAGDTVSEAEVLEEEFHGVNPVHHLTLQQLQLRLQQAEDAGYAARGAGDAVSDRIREQMLLPRGQVPPYLHQRHRHQLDGDGQ